MPRCTRKPLISNNSRPNPRDAKRAMDMGKIIQNAAVLAERPLIGD